MTRRQIKLKRVYRPRSSHDGVRVLVDRLWPRGLSRKDAAADLWIKHAAPSPALRRWYGHDPRRWERFRKRYRRELAQQPQALHALDELRSRRPVTLLFAAADEAHSHAVVLREVLEEGVVQ